MCPNLCLVDVRKQRDRKWNWTHEVLLLCTPSVVWAELNYLFKLITKVLRWMNQKLWTVSSSTTIWHSRCEPKTETDRWSQSQWSVCTVCLNHWYKLPERITDNSFKANPVQPWLHWKLSRTCILTAAVCVHSTFEISNGLLAQTKFLRRVSRWWSARTQQSCVGSRRFVRMCGLDFGDGSIDGIKMATLAKAPIYLLK